jgi:hypothetical protein
MPFEGSPPRFGEAAHPRNHLAKQAPAIVMVYPSTEVDVKLFNR